MKKILLIIFLLSISKFSWSYFYNTEDLYQKCISEEPMQIGLCAGYIMGVYDVVVNENEIEYRTKKEKNELYDFRLCDVDRIINNSQIIDVFVDWVEDNPKKRSWSAEGNIQSLLIVWMECGFPRSVEARKKLGY